MNKKKKKKNFSDVKLRGMQAIFRRMIIFSNLNPLANNIQIILINRTQNKMIYIWKARCA